jgi:murein L,D-transpeptidase YafK
MNAGRGVALFFAALLVAAGAPAPSPEQAGLIVIKKAKRELILMRGERVLKSYRVSLGPNAIGPKTRQGDGKTPEGLYKVIGRNPGSAYHRSLRLDYPNAQDRARARRLGVSPGGDIMIHGLPNGQGYIGAAHRLYDWTLGCIAVTNEEIEEIWRLVPNGTPVRIEP